MVKRAAATERTRLRIQDGLLRLLASRPYESITMADVAAAAGVSVRTVQRHYGSKDDLLVVCVGSFVRELENRLARLPVSPTPRRAVEGFVRAVFGIYRRHNAMASVAYRRAASVPRVEEAVRQGVDIRLAFIDRMVSRWPDAWRVDVRRVRGILTAMTSYLTWTAFTQRGRVSGREAVSGVTLLLASALLRD